MRGRQTARHFVIVLTNLYLHNPTRDLEPVGFQVPDRAEDRAGYRSQIGSRVMTGPALTLS